MVSLSNFQARCLILHLQGLCNNYHKPSNLYSLLKKLGYVQVDSIQYVERAHHMILFTRDHNYRPEHLVSLLEEKRKAFENWTHDASIIPICFYPYFLHIFKRREKKLLAKFDKWQGSGYRKKCKALLATIKKNGALLARDLPKEKIKLSMWQWHENKTALEFLWRTGKLSISGRRGFQKLYDLTSRTIPGEYRNKKISHKQFIDWSCNFALKNLGFGTAVDIANFWNFLSVEEVKQWLEKNKVREVLIGNKILFCRGDIKTIIKKMPKPPNKIRILSPFDSVVRNRKRLQWLFNFDYKIEIYVPEKKRKWGYYVFPILRGCNFIGRIEMKANRKTKTLEVKNIWWQRGIKISKTINNELKQELKAHTKFAGLQNLQV